jgi:hypothetical protein
MSIGRWGMVPLVAICLVASGCGQPSARSAEATPHALVETIEGTDLHRITLTQQAADRLGIQTAAAREAPDPSGDPRLVIPYSAVIYDAHGGAWAYVNGEPLVFQRHPITVHTIVGDQAFLSEGPASGTSVVSVGVAELYGTEFEVGH